MLRIETTIKNLTNARQLNPNFHLNITIICLPGNIKQCTIEYTVFYKRTYTNCVRIKNTRKKSLTEARFQLTINCTDS